MDFFCIEEMQKKKSKVLAFVICISFPIKEFLFLFFCIFLHDFCSHFPIDADQNLDPDPYLPEKLDADPDLY